MVYKNLPHIRIYCIVLIVYFFFSIFNVLLLHNFSPDFFFACHLTVLINCLNVFVVVDVAPRHPLPLITGFHTFNSDILPVYV